MNLPSGISRNRRAFRGRETPNTRVIDLSALINRFDGAKSSLKSGR